MRVSLVFTVVIIGGCAVGGGTEVRPYDPNAGASSSGGSSSGPQAPPAKNPNAELAELFEAPTNTDATPGIVLGVWAPDGSDRRASIGASS